MRIRNFTVLTENDKPISRFIKWIKNGPHDENINTTQAYRCHSRAHCLWYNLAGLEETLGREPTQFLVRHLPTLILVHSYKPSIASPYGNRLVVRMRKWKSHVLVVVHGRWDNWGPPLGRIVLH